MAVAQSMMTPREIVHELDKHIVGQSQAKRAVAVALRNRWRRQQVPEPLRSEIVPKGVGKTEIARRLARLAQAPFIKVEATKFTEVGYVGRDVDAIIRDLADIAYQQVRAAAMRLASAQAADQAEQRLLDILLGASDANAEGSGASAATRQKFLQRLRDGQLDDREVDIDVAVAAPSLEVLAPPGMADFSQQLQGLFQGMGGQKRRSRRVNVREALRLFTEEEAARRLDDEALRRQAVELAQDSGIVFLDEIDKIASRSESQGADVSRQGVQRDLLPLVEGTAVNTKYGVVLTDHILFIASGAFHYAKPSDLMPELQGRFPIRVELDSLGVNEFEHILAGTDGCLTRQYEALLATEDVQLEFLPDGVRRLAEIAFDVNARTENIGARRLHTLLERLLEDIAFDAGSRGALGLQIDRAFVDERLGRISADENLARYIL